MAAITSAVESTHTKYVAGRSDFIFKTPLYLGVLASMYINMVEFF